MVRPTVARVDLGALKSNYRHIVERLAGDRPVNTPRPIAVVKANAYGHGAAQVGRALEDAGADLLACADIEEGAALRAAGVRAEILVFGALSVSDLDGLFDGRLTPTISTPGAARAVHAAAARYKQSIRYHLKIDTGMNRLGFRFDNLGRTLPEVFASRHLDLSAVYTHFATAEDPASALFEQQRLRFERALGEIDQLRGPETPALRFGADSAAQLPGPETAAQLPGPETAAQLRSPETAAERVGAAKTALRFGSEGAALRLGRERPVPEGSAIRGPELPPLRHPYVHASNSAALLRDPRVWYDRVRPGLLLYGVVPPPLTSTIDLTPVMTLRSRVVAVKGMRPGDVSGYGARFTAGHPTTLAIVPAGYADGLDLRMAGRGAVLIRGRRASVVGSVCMDMLMADVTGMDVSPGDEVVIIGSQGDDRIDVSEMAATIGSIPWEILCRIGSRIERIYT